MLATIIIVALIFAVAVAYMARLVNHKCEPHGFCECSRLWSKKYGVHR